MKKISILTGVALLLLASCSGNNEKEVQDSLKIAQLTADYHQAATFNDSLMLLMADIYNGLDSINMQEGLLYNMGNGENTDRRAEVRHNLSAIKDRLAANRALLAQMEKKAKESGNKSALLSKTIDQMKERLDQQDAKISNLEHQLTVARDSIVTLNENLAATQEQVQVQTEAKEAAWNAYNEAEDRMNTVYYAIGTNKELKENGLLEKKFLGQTKVLKGDFNEEYFTKADKRTLSEIPTGAKKIKIWTNMPADSYTEIENADKTITLKITNPTQFWSMTPYLVIQAD